MMSSPCGTLEMARGQKSGARRGVYSVYGVRLRTSLRLPIPAATTDSGPEIVISERVVNSPPAATFEQRPNGSEVARLAGGAVIVQWPNRFRFRISPDGRELTYQILDNSCGEAFETYLLGPVLSFALLKIGLEHLHATAVVIDGAAVALIGDSTFGKSSLAAGFIGAGHRLLSDDLLVLRSRGGRLWAYPGPPRLKLFPDMAERAFGARTGGARFNPVSAKLHIALDKSERLGRPAPLKHIYCLSTPGRTDENGRVRLVRCSRRTALLELLRSNYNCVVMDQDRMQGHLDVITAVLAAVPVRRISYPRHAGALPKVVERIVADVGGE